MFLIKKLYMVLLLCAGGIIQVIVSIYAESHMRNTHTAHGFWTKRASNTAPRQLLWTVFYIRIMPDGTTWILLTV